MTVLESQHYHLHFYKYVLYLQFGIQKSLRHKPSICTAALYGSYCMKVIKVA